MRDTTTRTPRRAAGRAGFTLMEVSLGITVVVFGLMALSASTLRTHALRKQNREKAVAQNSIRMVSESIHALSQDALREATPESTWSTQVVAALVEGGELGPTFDVFELNAPPNTPTAGTIQIVTDETLTDEQLGVEIGMPRDLNGDGDAADTNVVGTARLHPVIVTVTWRGPNGQQDVRQPFYVLGY